MKRSRPYFLMLSAFIYAFSLHAQTAPQLIDKGNMAYNARNYPGAAQYYEAAIKKDVQQQWPEALFNLGNALFQQKKYAEAARQFKALAKAPVASSLKDAALYNLGNCLLIQNQYKDAADIYRDVLKSNPHDQDARYNLSFATALLQNEEGHASQVQSLPQPNDESQLPPESLSPEDLQRLLQEVNNSESQTRQHIQKQQRKKKTVRDW